MFCVFLLITLIHSTLNACQKLSLVYYISCASILSRNHVHYAHNAFRSVHGSITVSKYINISITIIK